MMNKLSNKFDLMQYLYAYAQKNNMILYQKFGECHIIPKDEFFNNKGTIINQENLIEFVKTSHYYRIHSGIKLSIEYLKPLEQVKFMTYLIEAINSINESAQRVHVKNPENAPPQIQMFDHLDLSKNFTMSDIMQNVYNDKNQIKPTLELLSHFMNYDQFINNDTNQTELIANVSKNIMPANFYKKMSQYFLGVIGGSGLENSPKIKEFFSESMKVWCFIEPQNAPLLTQKFAFLKYYFKESQISTAKDEPTDFKRIKVNCNELKTILTGDDISLQKTQEMIDSIVVALRDSGEMAEIVAINSQYGVKDIFFALKTDTKLTAKIVEDIIYSSLESSTNPKEMDKVVNKIILDYTLEHASKVKSVKI